MLGIGDLSHSMHCRAQSGSFITTMATTTRTRSDTLVPACSHQYSPASARDDGCTLTLQLAGQMWPNQYDYDDDSHCCKLFGCPGASLLASMSEHGCLCLWVPHHLCLGRGVGKTRRGHRPLTHRSLLRRIRSSCIWKCAEHENDHHAIP